MDVLVPRAKGVALSALRNFGALNQINKTQEELLELVVALGRHKKFPEIPKSEVIDELADSVLTIMQMWILFGFKDCQDRFEFKLDRLDKLLSSRNCNL